MENTDKTKANGACASTIIKRLSCKPQHYQWGKQGPDGVVASLLKDYAIEEDEYYAELWMGTHPNLPSELDDEASTLLKDYIKQHPDVLGEHEGGDLKFLFKVLSVAKALSVQSHPNKEKARELHAKDPKNYPDANHKPEMAIALTPFELLCGFRTSHEILSNIKAHKELLELIGEENLTELAVKHHPEKQKAALKKVFTQIWNSSEEEIKHVITEITGRLLINEGYRTTIDELILRLNEQYPEDIGVLAPFFLNYSTLKPGEAVYFGPNEPHSYLSGDCIECMALSDNTIRAGLTPKFKDVKTLCENLTYNMGDPPIFCPLLLPDGVTEYSTPFDEFAVHKIKNVSKLESLAAASIMIIIEGEAKQMHSGNNDIGSIERGDVLFIPQLVKCTFTEPSEDFLAFRAFTPPPKK